MRLYLMKSISIVLGLFFLFALQEVFGAPHASHKTKVVVDDTLKSSVRATLRDAAIASLNPSETFLHGLFVDSYVSDRIEEGSRGRYISLYSVDRLLSRSSQAAKANFGKAHLPVIDFRLWLDAFGPQVSPDGSRLLFKTPLLGEYYDKDTICNTHLINLKTHQLEDSPKIEFGYRCDLPWSPNSRYLAYFSGGDALGALREGENSYGVHIYDLQHNRIRNVSVTVEAPFLAWTPRNTLLFDMTKEEPVSGQAGVRDSASTAGERRVVHKLYEAAADGGQPVLLFDGERPFSASPDGVWIAYRREVSAGQPWMEQSSVRTQESSEPPSNSICLYNRNTKRRINVALSESDYYSLTWTADSKQVLAMSYQNVWVVDVLTLSVKTLKLDLPIDKAYMIQKGGYQSQGTSQDGNYLFVTVHAEAPPDVMDTPDIYGYFCAIDLKTGSVEILAQTKNDRGLAWWLPPAASPIPISQYRTTGARRAKVRN